MVIKVGPPGSAANGTGAEDWHCEQQHVHRGEANLGTLRKLLRFPKKSWITNRRSIVDLGASFASSSAQALGVYIVSLLIASAFDAAAVGQFRYILAVIAILQAFTLVEANKIFLKHYYEDGTNYLLQTLLLRGGAAILVAAGAATAADIGLFGSAAPKHLLIAAILLSPFYLDLYHFINFARREYTKNAVANFLRNILTFLAVLVAILLVDSDLAEVPIGVYFLCVAVSSFVLFIVFARNLGVVWRWSKDFAKDSLKLSAGGIPQTLVENLDKIVVGAILGPTSLGIYAINVTTGRLFSTILKPALIVAYPYLTKNRLGRRYYVATFLASALVVIIFTLPLYQIFLMYASEIYISHFLLVIIAMSAFPFSAIYQLKLNEVIFNAGGVSTASKSGFVVAATALTTLSFSAILGSIQSMYIAAAALPLRYAFGCAYVFWATYRDIPAQPNGTQ